MKTTPAPALVEHDFGQETSIKKSAFRHHQWQGLAVWTKRDNWLGFEFWSASAAGEEKRQRERERDGGDEAEKRVHE
jgi:hypothetical protein